jgi:hypothetical protein
VEDAQARGIAQQRETVCGLFDLEIVHAASVAT